MLVDSDRYLLTCHRYIELNPVRAGIVDQPADYSYSSYARNALGKTDEMVTEHELYTRFVEDGLETYVRLFDHSLSRRELTAIRRATMSGTGVGKPDFLLRVANLVEPKGPKGSQGSDSNAAHNGPSSNNIKRI